MTPAADSVRSAAIHRALLAEHRAVTTKKLYKAINENPASARGILAAFRAALEPVEGKARASRLTEQLRQTVIRRIQEIIRPWFEDRQYLKTIPFLHGVATLDLRNSEQFIRVVVGALGVGKARLVAGNRKRARPIFQTLRQHLVGASAGAGAQALLEALLQIVREDVTRYGQTDSVVLLNTASGAKRPDLVKVVKQVVGAVHRSALERLRAGHFRDAYQWMLALGQVSRLLSPSGRAAMRKARRECVRKVGIRFDGHFRIARVLRELGYLVIGTGEKADGEPALRLVVDLESTHGKPLSLSVIFVPKGPGDTTFPSLHLPGTKAPPPGELLAVTPGTLRQLRRKHRAALAGARIVSGLSLAPVTATYAATLFGPRGRVLTKLTRTWLEKVPDTIAGKCVIYADKEVRHCRANPDQAHLDKEAAQTARFGIESKIRKHLGRSAVERLLNPPADAATAPGRKGKGLPNRKGEHRRRR